MHLRMDHAVKIDDLVHQPDVLFLADELLEQELLLSEFLRLGALKLLSLCAHPVTYLLLSDLTVRLGDILEGQVLVAI